LMMKAIRSPETSVITRTTRHNILEDYILQRNVSWKPLRIAYDARYSYRSVMDRIS
jgi:hypothetical protein